MAKDQLALRIRAFRKLKGYTQSELAEHIGVSVAVLGAIERNTRQADDKIVTKISDALGIDKSELMEESDN